MSVAEIAQGSKQRASVLLAPGAPLRELTRYQLFWRMHSDAAVNEIAVPANDSKGERADAAWTTWSKQREPPKAIDAPVRVEKTEVRGETCKSWLSALTVPISGTAIKVVVTQGSESFTAILPVERGRANLEGGRCGDLDLRSAGKSRLRVTPMGATGQVGPTTEMELTVPQID
ncbi:MAG TPA: hypothetical protein VGK67_35945 [Myxococcales bacterium]|jgi:hypothetical protein